MSLKPTTTKKTSQGISGRTFQDGEETKMYYVQTHRRRDRDDDECQPRCGDGYEQRDRGGRGADHIIEQEGCCNLTGSCCRSGSWCCILFTWMVILVAFTIATIALVELNIYKNDHSGRQTVGTYIVGSCQTDSSNWHEDLIFVYNRKCETQSYSFGGLEIEKDHAALCARSHEDWSYTCMPMAPDQ